MPATVVIGAQWGDEGKGRVADWLAADSDIVARYAGGDNAGHTVYVQGKVHKLHLIPSGILREHIVGVLGNGMVVNPISLVREIKEFRDKGIKITPENLLLSTRAHLITPAHVALDAASEAQRGAGKIGTTLRGIGPAYMDKTGRKGIRAGQMQDIELYAEALQENIAQANTTLTRDGFAAVSVDDRVAEAVEAAEFLRPFLCDTTLYLNAQLRKGAQILCEGAQGTFLDIDHGDYPFVTSSSPTVGGAMIGLGIGPRAVNRIVGVTKAFSTRVGSGPMPTELDGELVERLRGTGDNFWDEFGTTTRRPRRCGWLDLVILRYAALVNDFTEIVLTKLDVLSGFETLNIATAYRIDDRLTEIMPSDTGEQARAVPVYETVPGWSEDLSAVRRWSDLPEATRVYIDRIAELAGVPIHTVCVGPERDQLVHR